MELTPFFFGLYKLCQVRPLPAHVGSAVLCPATILALFPSLAQTPTVGTSTAHVFLLLLVTLSSPLVAYPLIGSLSLVPTTTVDAVRSLRCDRRIGWRPRREGLASTNHRTVFLIQESNYLRRGPLPAGLCAYGGPDGRRCQNLRHGPPRSGRNEKMGGSPRRSGVGHDDRYRGPKHL